MNDMCRFFVDQEGWFITNQNLGTQDPFTVGRNRKQDRSITKTFDELARQKDWRTKSHSGDLLSTLVGGLGLQPGINWLCVNFNRFRFEVRDGEDRKEILETAKKILQIAIGVCLGLNTEEVDDIEKVFSDEDRARLDEEDDPFADYGEFDDLNDELAEQVDPIDETE